VASKQNLSRKREVGTSIARKAPAPPKLTSAIERWFPSAARNLPWRTTPRDPYAALVAEAMLQQTQVSRVVPKFEAFLARFPTPAALARANEPEVLAAWAGLGYYRRAKNLHAAAKAIVADFAGRVPTTVDELRRLPGVGPYTAGAIASIVFDRPEPIVDGNVARVLLRVHGRDASASDRTVQPWLWERAGELARAAASPAVVNEGLMELGATVCLPAPAEPRCDACPLRAFCTAQREGLTSKIPRPKPAAARTRVYFSTLIVVDPRGRVLLEPRSSRGMWASLAQPPTIERTDRPATPAELAAHVGLTADSVRAAGIFAGPALAFTHTTTHRDVVFEASRADAPRGFTPRAGGWSTLDEALASGISNPVRKILLALGGLPTAGSSRTARDRG
jgi:A/G-specific adenine glycosylase